MLPKSTLFFFVFFHSISDIPPRLKQRAVRRLVSPDGAPVAQGRLDQPLLSMCFRPPTDSAGY